MCTIIVSFGNFYLDHCTACTYSDSHFSMGMHFNNNQLTVSSLYGSDLAWDSLLLAFIYMGVVNSFLLVPLTTLHLCLVLSKVVALVVNLGKSQQYKLNEANLCGGHTCVIVDGGLYSFIHLFVWIAAKLCF